MPTSDRSGRMRDVDTADNDQTATPSPDARPDESSWRSDVTTPEWLRNAAAYDNTTTLSADQLRALAAKIDRLSTAVTEARLLVEEMLPWVDGDGGVASAWLIDHGTKFLNTTNG